MLRCVRQAPRAPGKGQSSYLLTIMLAAGLQSEALEVFVDPTNGDDSALSGSRESPLRSLGAARDRVRSLLARSRQSAPWPSLSSLVIEVGQLDAPARRLAHQLLGRLVQIVAEEAARERRAAEANEQLEPAARPRTNPSAPLGGKA